MRRIMNLLAACLLCLSLAAPAFAAEEFVPSISYKDGPGIVSAAQGEETLEGCVVVTSIAKAKDKSTDIYQEDRDLLLEVYEKLSDGSMKLPEEDAHYVIRELVDVGFEATDCVEAEHGHREWLREENTEITVDFDLGVSADDEIIVMAYIDEVWNPINSVTNNGDGTLTCVFEDFCPVVFCLEAEAAEAAVEAAAPAAPVVVPTVPAAPAADEGGNEMLMFWLAIMLVCLLLLVLLLMRRRRKDGKKDAKSKTDSKDKKADQEKK